MPGTKKPFPLFWIFVFLLAASLAFSKGMILAAIDYAAPLGYNVGAIASWLFICGGFGWLLPAILRLKPQKILLPGAVMFLLCGILQTVFSGFPSLCVFFSVAAGFTNCLFQYGLICGMFREIAYNRRGTAFGMAFGLSTLLNLPTRLSGLPFPGLQTVIGQEIYAISLMALVVLYLWITRRKQWGESTQAGAKERGIPTRLVSWVMVCLFFMYVAYGMYNYMLDAYQFGRSAEFEYARIADVFANILVGLLCDYIGRSVTLIASAVLMMSGSLMTLTGFNGTISVVLQALSIIGVLCFTIPVRLMLVDASFSSKRPYLFCALGFIGVNWFYSLGAPLAEAALFFGEMGPFAVSIALCLFVIPCITYIVERIRRYQVEDQQLVFEQMPIPELSADVGKLCSGYGLTKRETQVFSLSLGHKNVMEIAQSLMVSETTVRVHLGNIRKKIDNGNGTSDLARILTEQDNAMQIERPASRDEMLIITEKYGLTQRESELFPYLLTSKTIDEIASELFVSPNTVKTHIRNIVTKAGVANRRELGSLLEQAGEDMPVG